MGAAYSWKSGFLSKRMGVGLDLSDLKLKISEQNKELSAFQLGATWLLEF